MSDQISTDENELDRAVVWGAKYKFNDKVNASYFGIDSKNALERHYVNANYKQALANNSSLTYDFSGYHTEFDEEAETYSQTTDDLSDRKNDIWAISGTYNTGYHNVMMLMASKVSTFQTHIFLTSLVMMRNLLKFNIPMTLQA